MKFFFALSCVLWGLAWGPRAVGPPVAESAVRFQIKNAGLTVDGTLAGVDATIQFDPAHPEQGHIQATVPVSTIRTGIGLRDQHLQKPDYFDAAQFPTIALQSKTIRLVGPGRFEGVFALTMKGITRDVTIPFTVSAAHEFRGQFQVNRLDYGLGKTSLVLADEVTVSVRARTAAGQ
ncbi:YceI family protein [Hymenobacter nivis]|uniref:YceI family protein n=1 Tax=Hymenobacter nivis TaxID=1850093 RepID=A0A502GWZ7_9BACT|nr:YceI family protein [Hymenobacter nivis]TPG65982.1 YceI family protein [Hymenobacter nivis]